MSIIGVDPGTAESAFVELLEDGTTVQDKGILPNKDLVRKFVLRPSCECCDLVLEWVSFYGPEIHAGSETFETCYWVGRFIQAWSTSGDQVWRIPRREIRQKLCGTLKAGDSEVRAVLIDRYGGKSVALGGKRCSRCKDGMTKTKTQRKCERCDGAGWAVPRGPLYDIVGDEWSALAVATVFADQQRKGGTQ